jgi:hypothetical protein
MLLFWSQHDQGNANEDQHSDAHEFPVLDEITECLKSHESGVEETRPRSKGNEAAMMLLGQSRVFFSMSRDGLLPAWAAPNSVR